MNAMERMAAQERERQSEALHGDGNKKGPRRKKFAEPQSREHDEAIVDWLARRENGEPIRAIAAIYGCSAGSVSRAVAAVRAEI